MPHVLKHVPAARRNAKGGKVTQVNAFLGAPAKDIHCVVDQGGRMAFTSDGDVANAIKFSPGVGAWVVCPDIIEPGNTVCATETGMS